MAEPRRLTQLAAQSRSVLNDCPGGDLVVGLSGGADSAAAAWLSVDSGRSVRAIHVHHGSVAADRLEVAAVSIANRLSIPLTFERVEVPAGPSYEARARTVRHEALTRTLGPAEWLVVGHTRDDQVETVLMRLVRGSGLDGLAGMGHCEPPYVRPLLDSSRSDARELAAITGMPWFDDPANLDRSHLRNRIRNDLLPVIESTFGAGLSTTLHRSAEVIRRDVSVLEDLASEIDRVVTSDAIRLSLSGLLTAHPGIAARAVRQAIRALEPPYPPPLRVVDTALDVAHRRVRRAEIGRLTVDVDGGWLLFTMGVGTS